MVIPVTQKRLLRALQLCLRAMRDGRPANPSDEKWDVAVTAAEKALADYVPTGRFGGDVEE